MEDLKLIYDDFNKAIATGDLDKALEYRDAESKKSILEYVKTPEAKAETLQMLKAMIPVSVTADHVDEGDQKKTLYLTGTFNNLEKPGETVRSELMVDFVKESDAWKMGTVMYLTNPDTIQKSPDENFEPQENYDLNSDTSMGGRIVSVKWEKDYTLVTIRMLNENDLVFLPSKVELEKAGIKAELLEPWKIIQISGHKHKTNPLKIWGVKAEPIQTE